jgi:hypothetical protein
MGICSLNHMKTQAAIWGTAERVYDGLNLAGPKHIICVEEA